MAPFNLVQIDGHEALLIVPTLDAYVSPRSYPSKAEHGKVVPTSNYELIHFHGVVEIHHDADGGGASSMISLGRTRIG